MSLVAETRRPLADLINWHTFPSPPGRRPHQRRFDAATEIQVLLRDDATLSRQVHNQPIGIGVYQPVPRTDPHACRHELTICRWCRRQWQQDHFLAVFTHGTTNAYRNQGCRCTTCGLATTDHDTATRPPESRRAARSAKAVSQAPGNG